MARPVAGQEELGNYAYLISSVGGSTNDYAVMAHSATVQGRNFFAPHGCTINYYAEPGRAYTMATGPIDHYRAISQRQPEANRTVHFGTPASDVILGKILGNHWYAPLDAGGADHYHELRREMIYSLQARHASWNPHIVVVRNRKWPHMNNEIWLSALVREIIKLRGSNIDIHLFGCLGLFQANKWRSGKQAFQKETHPDR